MHMVMRWLTTRIGSVHVEAPIIFEPDHVFESLDGRAPDKDAWLEVQLRPERPIPFKCAVSSVPCAMFGLSHFASRSRFRRHRRSRERRQSHTTSFLRRRRAHLRSHARSCLTRRSPLRSCAK